MKSEPEIRLSRAGKRALLKLRDELRKRLEAVLAEKRYVHWKLRDVEIQLHAGQWTEIS